MSLHPLILTELHSLNHSLYSASQIDGLDLVQGFPTAVYLGQRFGLYPSDPQKAWITGHVFAASQDARGVTPDCCIIVVLATSIKHEATHCIQRVCSVYMKRDPVLSQYHGSSPSVVPLMLILSLTLTLTHL